MNSIYGGPEISAGRKGSGGVGKHLNKDLTNK
jgi:hypothetical protein